MSSPLRIDRRGAVVVMTLDRPHVRNAIDAELAHAIAASLDALEADDELRVGVLTGAGGCFSAGMDLKAFTEGSIPMVDGRGFGGIAQRSAGKPLIAAVESFAVAGGLEVALACDLLVAARGARLGLPEVKRSLVAGGGGLMRLPQRLPFNIAAEVALTGEPILAERAHELGLVNRLAEEGGALDAALEIANSIAANGPLAVAATMRLLAGARDWTVDEYWANQEGPVDRVAASSNAQEGARAFAERRDPVWTGS